MRADIVKHTTTYITAKKILCKILETQIFDKHKYHELLRIQAARSTYPPGIKIRSRRFPLPRESKRTFSGSLNTEKFEGILSACYKDMKKEVTNPYSLPHLTYPSAGGINSCEIYIWTNLEKYCGISKYNPYKNEIIKINQDFDIKHLIEYHNNFPIDKINFAIIYAIDLRPMIVKYGNRGILYSILEVGHAAQNLLLLSEQYHLDTLPIGAISIKYLSKYIEDSFAIPIYAIVGSGKNES